MTSKALILLSGGQDSSTCLFWALKQFDQVQSIGFDYGQRHVIELEFAAKIANKAGVPFDVIKLSDLLGNSALTQKADESLNLSDAHPSNEKLPASFVPGRNALFFNLAAIYAYNRGIFNLVSGICQTDQAGYPDCREDFRSKMEETLSLALDTSMQIHAPLMFKTKAETWKLAHTLGCLDIIRDHTLTDYNGHLEKHEWGYGSLDNTASKLRAESYFEAKAKNWLD